jgi:hypothetical protein
MRAVDLTALRAVDEVFREIFNLEGPDEREAASKASHHMAAWRRLRAVIADNGGSAFGDHGSREK